MTRPVSLRSAGFRASVVIGVAGVIGCGLGLSLDPGRLARAYLVGYAAVLSLVLGALAMVMIAHLTSATWFVVLRRLAEATIGALPVLVVLWIPIWIGLKSLYPWAAPASLDGAARMAVLAKRAYLNPGFFIARALMYFATWLGFAEALRRVSRRQDAQPGPALTVTQRRLSAIGLPILGLTLSFAAFDWLMATSATWYSTVFGVYVFTGGFAGALALVAVMAASAAGSELAGTIRPDHFHALGKLLFTAVLLWAYIAYAQYFIIWIAGIPIEVAWIQRRQRGSWGVLGLVVLATHFALPFLALLLRNVKRTPRAMMIVGGLLLVAHYLDVYWIVMPEFSPTALSAHWLDLAGLAFVGGTASAFVIAAQGREASLPVGDPELALSKGYETE